MTPQRIVLDVSTSAKWFLPRSDEPFHEQAMHLWLRYDRGELDFLTPDLFWAEFGNVLLKAVRRKRITASAADEAFSTIRDVSLLVAPSRTLAPEAWRIANLTGRSFYDSLYVALAEQSGAPLITADERLANALAARWPVQWLGAL